MALLATEFTAISIAQLTANTINSQTEDTFALNIGNTLNSNSISDSTCIHDLRGSFGPLLGLQNKQISSGKSISVPSSYDGQFALARDAQDLYLTKDYGITWSLIGTQSMPICISNNGKYILFGPNLSLSSDYGDTFHPYTVPGKVGAAKILDDGTKYLLLVPTGPVDAKVILMKDNMVLFSQPIDMRGSSFCFGTLAISDIGILLTAFTVAESIAYFGKTTFVTVPFEYVSSTACNSTKFLIACGDAAGNPHNIFFFDGKISELIPGQSVSVTMSANSAAFTNYGSGTLSYYNTAWVNTAIPAFEVSLSPLGNILYVSTPLRRFTIPTKTSFMVPLIDNDVSLGSPSSRYTNGYFSEAVYANGIQLTSDERYKRNIVPLLETKIDQLRPMKYEMDGKIRFGLLAQELQKIYPELVEGEDRLSIDMPSLVALLIKEVQDLKKQIDKT